MLLRESGEAHEAYRAAEAAHALALREYETTPEGRSALEQAVARLEAQGETAAAEAARARLVEANETRRRQVADLASARRYRTRLDAPTVDELAALDQADADVHAKEATHAEATRTYEQAHRAWSELGEEAAAADRAEADAARTFAEATELAIEARTEAHAQAVRLYVEAGISQRFATFYANDMAEAASRTSNRPPYGQGRGVGDRTADTGPQRPMVMKVKRDGPDRDKTLAAKAAAETDAGYILANAHLAEAIEHTTAAKERLDTIRADAGFTIRDGRQQALSVASTARYAMEDAASDVERARARREDVRARVGSGVGVQPTSTVALARARDEIVRNPDGTTNAFVYDPPAEGFPHGRYIAAVDVATVHGMSAANALVLENGRKAWLHGHYARTTRGAGETQSGYQQVVLTEPQEGSSPLREENVATAGFYTFVDSSD